MSRLLPLLALLLLGRWLSRPRRWSLDGRRVERELAEALRRAAD